MPATKNITVVLFNLGGPGSLNEVRPFLRNLFGDPDIFKLPFGKVGQQIFAALISFLRAPTSQKYYDQIDGGSPIADNTRKQAQALGRALSDQAAAFRVVTAQRYWHPLIAEVISDVRPDKPDQIILLPLFPQYSATTTASVLNEWNRHWGNNQPRPITIDRFFADSGYLEACTGRIREKLPLFKGKPYLLFSAHGLPVSRIKQGDPYGREIAETVRLIMDQFPEYDHSLCFQSRVGPVKWLEPSIGNELKRLYQQGVKQVLVFPVSFVSEHLETLYELGLYYRKQANALGMQHFEVAETVGTHPAFIDGLKNLILEKLVP